MSRKIIENYKNRRQSEQPEISEAEAEIYRQQVVDLLVPVVEYYVKNPDQINDDENVSIDDLLAEMRNPPPAPVTVQTVSGQRRRNSANGTIEILGESAPAAPSQLIGEADTVQKPENSELLPPEMPESLADLASVIRGKNYRR